MMMERLAGMSPSLECTPQFHPAPPRLQSHISSAMNDTIAVFYCFSSRQLAVCLDDNAGPLVHNIASEGCIAGTFGRHSLSQEDES